MKAKTCKNCSKKFEPSRPLQSVCSSRCAYEYTLKLKEKKAKEDVKRMAANLETTSELRQTLQTLINKIVRQIDYGQPCISCGIVKAQMQAGHFWHKSKNGERAVTFHLFNLWGQCVYCNMHQGGNLLNYSRGIVKNFGAETLQFMHDLAERYRGLEWDKPELKEAISKATMIFKLMQKDQVKTKEQRIELRKKINNELNLYAL